MSDQLQQMLLSINELWNTEAFDQMLHYHLWACLLKVFAYGIGIFISLWIARDAAKELAKLEGSTDAADSLDCRGHRVTGVVALLFTAVLTLGLVSELPSVVYPAGSLLLELLP